MYTLGILIYWRHDLYSIIETDVFVGLFWILFTHVANSFFIIKGLIFKLSIYRNAFIIQSKTARIGAVAVGCMALCWNWVALRVLDGDWLTLKGLNSKTVPFRPYDRLIFSTCFHPHSVYKTLRVNFPSPCVSINFIFNNFLYRIWWTYRENDTVG